MPLCTLQEVLWPAVAGRCMDAALARRPLNSAALPLCTAIESALAGRGADRISIYQATPRSKAGPQALAHVSAASSQAQAWSPLSYALASTSKA